MQFEHFKTGKMHVLIQSLLCMLQIEVDLISTDTAVQKVRALRTVCL